MADSAPMTPLYFGSGVVAAGLTLFTLYRAGSRYLPPIYEETDVRVNVNLRGWGQTLALDFAICCGVIFLQLLLSHFRSKFGFLYRAALSFFTSLAVLGALWLWSPHEVVWTTNNAFFKSLCFTGFIAAWLILAAQTLFIDPLSLFGIPSWTKGWEIQRLYSHSRHSSVTPWLAILLLTPIMTWDRLLVTIVSAIYLLFFHQLDIADVGYLQGEFEKNFSWVVGRVPLKH